MNAIQRSTLVAALAVVALVAAAALGGFAGFSDVASVLSAAIFLPFLGTVTGAIEEDSTPTDHKVRHVDRRLTERMPQANVLNTLMRKLRRGERMRSEKIEWETDDAIPRVTTTTGATSAGSAGAAVTLTVVNGNYYLTDDTLLLPNNVTAENAVLVVMSVDSTLNTISVRRWDGGTSTTYGTVPAIGSGEKLVRTGNLKEEGYGMSESRTTMPGGDYNYAESHDAVIEITNRRAATANYTKDDWQRNRDRQLYDFLSSEEYKLFFGKREKKRVTRGGKSVNVTSQGGVLSYNIPNALTYTSGTFSELDILEFHRVIFTGNTGSDVRYAFIDSLLGKDLATIPLDKLQRTQVDSKTLRMGVTETSVEGNGKIRWVPQQMFNEAGKTRFGVVLDIEQCSIHHLEPMETNPIDRRKTDGRQSKVVQVTETFSTIWRYMATHATIEGS
jgi:hypothetical protein